MKTTLIKQIENSYEEQAKNFLTITNTTMTVYFLRHALYFDEDKEARDIYQVTLSREDRQYQFEFGQSIVNSGFYYTKGRQKINIDRSMLNKKYLGAHLRSMDSSFLNNGKSDVIHYPKAPTAYDILACITKYSPGTFEDFCSEFGYNEDSKTAEKTYNAVMEEFLNIERLFSPTEMELLQEIN